MVAGGRGIKPSPKNIHAGMARELACIGDGGSLFISTNSPPRKQNFLPFKGMQYEVVRMDCVHQAHHASKVNSLFDIIIPVQLYMYCSINS